MSKIEQVTHFTESLSYKYKAIHKPNQLIYGIGTVVVITGWTPKERVAKLLKPEQYAVIGNLYSPAGVDLVIRNVLNNPHVTGFLFIEATSQDKNSASISHFFDFLNGAVNIGNDIHSDDIKRIRKLRRTILFGVDRSLLEDRLSLVAECKPLGGEAKIYPVPQIKSSTVPSPLYGHRVEGKTIAETWVKILHRIRSGGVLRPTGYDGQWQELIDLMAIVTDEPEGFYFPEPSYLPCDREFIKNYIPSMLEDAPHVPGVKYTYGQRLRSHFGHDQIEQVVQKLASEIDAASAVMSLWDSEDHVRGGSPCLNQVWVRVVNQELSLTAVLRSNDMFNAWAANAFGLRALQQHIKERLRKETSENFLLGPLIILSQSAHLYDHSFAYADEVVQKYYRVSPKIYNDPVGNYLIEVVKEEIKVSRMDAKGNTVQEYAGQSIGALQKAITLDAPAMQVDHAMYLGGQLEQAWDALQKSKKFTQR